MHGLLVIIKSEHATHVMWKHLKSLSSQVLLASNFYSSFHYFTNLMPANVKKPDIKSGIQSSFCKRAKAVFELAAVTDLVLWIQHSWPTSPRGPRRYGFSLTGAVRFNKQHAHSWMTKSTEFTQYFQEMDSSNIFRFFQK